MRSHTASAHPAAPASAAHVSGVTTQLWNHRFGFQLRFQCGDELHGVGSEPNYMPRKAARPAGARLSGQARKRVPPSLWRWSHPTTPTPQPGWGGWMVGSGGKRSTPPWVIYIFCCPLEEASDFSWPMHEMIFGAASRRKKRQSLFPLVL